MIYRGFITANSLRTAAADVRENLAERKRKEREKGRPPSATPPTSHLLRVSSHDVSTWRPFWAGPQTPHTTTTRSILGNPFSLFVPWNVLTLKQGSRSAHDVSVGYMYRRDLTLRLSREFFRVKKNALPFDSNNFAFITYMYFYTVFIHYYLTVHLIVWTVYVNQNFFLSFFPSLV